jgi:hypothetical protein
MKDKLYSMLAKMFSKYVDGQNKDGIFFTIDGQQYNLKIVAKKTPVDFGQGKTSCVKTAAPATIDITWNELIRKEIIDIFGEEINYVQNS